jgi:hypothetical protein
MLTDRNDRVDLSTGGIPTLFGCRIVLSSDTYVSTALMGSLTTIQPFRLLPNLPPKRIGRKSSPPSAVSTNLPADANFLEQRRKGLKRFINSVVNHPVIKDDGALNVFLVEPHFEAWRKRTKVSLDEESASKKLNPAQEMGIPSDLDDKLKWVDMLRMWNELTTTVS